MPVLTLKDKVPSTKIYELIKIVGFGVESSGIRIQASIFLSPCSGDYDRDRERFRLLAYSALKSNFFFILINKETL